MLSPRRLRGQQAPDCSAPSTECARGSLLPSPALVRLAFATAGLFCVAYASTVAPSLLDTGVPGTTRALLCLKVVVEMAFSFPAATMILVSLAHLLATGGEKPRWPRPANAAPSVGIVYLCCGDLDVAAVRSLCRIRHGGELHFVLHDDTPGGDPRVDALAAEISNQPGRVVHVLRRGDTSGGKPGALNHVLARLGARFEYFLICDNDSFALDPDCLERMLAPMADPRVAVVQARNVAVESLERGRVNRILCHAIDVFHLMLDAAQRWGWTPFVGHNALLRRSAVEAVGGFTPGCFADDIDLTVRLNLQGLRVVYDGDVRFGERHPPSYAAFRKRTYKWAYGSSQVLRSHLWSVLRTRRLSGAEKWGFLNFIGFYTLQTILLAYVALLYLLGPLVLRANDFDLEASVISGSLIPLLIFLPVIAFSVRQGRMRSLPGFVATCWLGYGATDFPTARGTIDALLGRARSWVPTNSVRSAGIDLVQLGEALFGCALLFVPLCALPQLLASPLTFVVAAKFLFIPTMSLLYDDREGRLAVPRFRIASAAVVLLLLGMLLPHRAPAQSTPTSESLPVVAVRGRTLLVDAHPYVVRGIHYGPWRPGTGPGRSPFPPREAIDEDLRLVTALHANTVLVYDPPRALLDAIHAHGLRALVALWIEWPQFGTPGFAARETEILDTVEGLRTHPAMLGWVLGNEVPAWLVSERGPELVAKQIEELYRKVKQRDGRHFVTHANWPSARALDLRFLDVCAFNVYALWPPEVVARGYGRFITEVLLPLAGDRPLLITEFGTNSLEAGEEQQAHLVSSCWHELRAAGAIGGFVFELADEWWKNYSNPKLDGAWWDRVEALDDHLRHDRDPEEYYGLVTGERRVKPAFAAVQAMFAEGAREPASDSFKSSQRIVTLIIAVAFASFVWAAWRRRSPRGRDPHDVR